VVDFISVGWWPVFNLADSAITCGVVLLVLTSLFPGRSKIRRSASAIGYADTRED
jgi:lipoprotein signal peptidase